MNSLTSTTMNMKELSMTTKMKLKASSHLFRKAPLKPRKMTIRLAIGFRADTYNTIWQKVWSKLRQEVSPGTTHFHSIDGPYKAGFGKQQSL